MIHLHIGRPKTGSTSIQEFLERIATALGPERRTFERHALSVAVGLRRRKTESVSTLDDFRSIFQSAPNATFFVSDEKVFRITDPELLDRIRATMAGHSIKLCIYVRDHASLLVSHYGQAVKKGSIVPDFDTFARQRMTTISGIPSITAWGQTFGWANVSIRSSSGNAVADYARTVGLSGFLTEADNDLRHNSSPSWIWLELFRHAFQLAQVPEGKSGPRFRAPRRLLEHIRVSAERRDLDLRGTTPYLTRAQWRTLRDSYNEELAFIASHTGAALPQYTEVEPEERPFLPSIERIPRPLAKWVAKFVVRFSAENDIERYVAESLRKALMARP